MAIILDGVVSGPTGYLNGAQVDAWNASRFTSVPAAGSPPPAGQPDAGPVLSGTNFGGPGQWRMEVPAVAAYYVRVTYPVGATNAKSYWAYDDSLVLTAGPPGSQGAQGAQGVQGFSGSQGPAGSPGVQGDTGPQGYQGSQGSQGAQGNMGLQGSQGFQGAQGYQGFQGNQGVVGPQGSASTVQGPQGYQGFQGFQGYQGNQGDMGNTGAQGAQGTQGYQGVTGAQGPQGALGNQGAQGYQGFQGTQGAPSTVQGPQGTQGAQGPQGFQGTTGAQGTTGSQGPQGTQGTQGYQGVTGAQGPQGYQGAGVPTGGTTGQALIKNSGTNYDTGWQSQLPLSGGTMAGSINMNSAGRVYGLVGPQSSTDATRAGDFQQQVPTTYHFNGSLQTIKAWTFDPTIASGTQTFGLLSNSNIYYVAVYLPYTTSLTGIVFMLGGAGVAVSSGQLGFYNSTTQLAVCSSANATSAWQQSANNVQFVPFTSTTNVTNLTAGVYYIAFSVNATTTIPALYRSGSNVTQVNNFGQAGFQGVLTYRTSQLGTGTLPSTVPNSVPNGAASIPLIGVY